MNDTNNTDPGRVAVRDRTSSKRPAVHAAKPDLKDPRVVLTLLEADQVVAAKRRTHFGRREFLVRNANPVVGPAHLRCGHVGDCLFPRSVRLRPAALNHRSPFRFEDSGLAVREFFRRRTRAPDQHRDSPTNAKEKAHRDSRCFVPCFACRGGAAVLYSLTEWNVPAVSEESAKSRARH